MENFASLLHGFGVALTTYHVALMMVGVLLGILVGVLPGLGAPNGVSLLLPLTFTMDPVSAIILLTSMYWGALFGGSTTSILFNIPGEPSSVATTFDGYPMAKQGKATQALTLAFLSAGFGALVGVILITVLSSWVAKFALRFSSPEYFAVYFLAFASFVGLGGTSPFKTVVSMGLGFAFAAVGMDTVSGGSAPDLRLQRASRRHQLPDRGDRPVRHRRAHAHHGGGAALRRHPGARQPARRAEDDRAHAALLGRAAAQQRDRLLDGHHARRTDGRLLHELRACQAPVPPQGRLSARASRKASSRPRPPTMRPAAAPSCRCWRSAFRVRRPPP